MVHNLIVSGGVERGSTHIYMIHVHTQVVGRASSSSIVFVLAFELKGKTTFFLKKKTPHRDTCMRAQWMPLDRL